MGAIGNKDNNGNFHFFTGVSVPEGLQMDLLWTNPNPTSSFAGQTLTLNLSQYKYIIMTNKYENVSTAERLPILLLINSTDTFCSIADTTEVIGRNITVSSNNIIISNGKLNGNTDNSKYIPLKIYGIK